MRRPPASTLSINNSGNLSVTATGVAWGIRGRMFNDGSPVTIVNSGDFVITSTGDTAYGIDAVASAVNSPSSIYNSGDLRVTAQSSAFGIRGIMP